MAPRRVHLTAPEWILPLLAVLGIASTPGEAPGPGAIDPALVRSLAETAAAAGNRTEWHLTLTETRDGTCTRPGCARPAAKTGYEHAIPYEAGGLTCACNGSATCRHDHKIKQHANWQVTQPLPGFRQWRVPSGRVYTSQPRQYPV